MIAKEVPKLEKPFHVLFFRLWLHWVHTEGRLTTIVQRFPSEQIGTDLFSTAEDCRLTTANDLIIIHVHMKAFSHRPLHSLAKGNTSW